MSDINLSVTLWPSFPHFDGFAKDDRISSIRLNSAMMNIVELDKELEKIKKVDITMPLYYDIKGRQLRITEVIPNNDYLDIRINHPIQVDTPTPVLFKAGADVALLHEVLEDGFRLKFLGGPAYMIKEGESLHIRDKSLVISGPQFTSMELEKIQKVKAAGLKHWFLSYVENQRDVDEFIELVGDDAIINLKIENKAGLEYVANEFKKTPNVNLVAARGDLYVEVDRPHEILAAVKMIIDKDPDAIVGSRILLSVITDPVPSCADFHELAWLTDIGYKNFMLCDELCLKGDLLGRAINVFQSFKDSYDNKPLVVTNPLNAFAPAPKKRKTASGLLRALFDGGLSPRAFFGGK
jgi:pyruvate kinase